MWRKSGLLLAALAAPLVAAVSLPTVKISESFASAKAFELEITWDNYAPLNIDRNMLLVNGQTPGPELVFDQDDDITVHVINNSPFNTTVHFHGTKTRLIFKKHSVSLHRY